jgi:hypothetical protein
LWRIVVNGGLSGSGATTLASCGTIVPRIDERQSGGLKVRQIACRQLKTVGECDSSDLKVRQFRGDLMQACAPGACSFKRFCRGQCGRCIEGIDPRTKTPDHPRNGGVECVAAFSGRQQRDAGGEFKNRDAADCAFWKALIEPLYDDG